jgi:hypothetical protein
MYIHIVIKRRTRNSVYFATHQFLSCLYCKTRFQPKREAGSSRSGVFVLNTADNGTGLVNIGHIVCLFLARQPSAGQGLLIHEVSRSHTTTHHSRKDSSGRVISPSQWPLPDNRQHSQQKNTHSLGGIRTHNLSAGERTQTYALDRAATGTGIWSYCQDNLLIFN